MEHSPKVVRKWESIPFLVWLAIVVAAIIVFLWLRFRTVEVPFDIDETIIEKTEISPTQAPQAKPTPTTSLEPQNQPQTTNTTNTTINNPPSFQPVQPTPQPTPEPQEPGLIEGAVDDVLKTVKGLL